MMINRHNYEEYFLLYVDNELTMHQRMEVEMFIQQHPDLAAELVALHKTVLPPDETAHLADKSFLHIRENAPVDITNYEELLLLYVDNELDAARREQVEQYAARHPHIQRQLNLLQQAVLPAEHIPFPGKQALYKRERPVIPMVIKRLAVAAAILGIVALGWWLMPSGKQNRIPALANTQKQQADPVIPATSANQATQPGQVAVNNDAGRQNQPAHTASQPGNSNPVKPSGNQPEQVNISRPDYTAAVQDKVQQAAQEQPKQSPVIARTAASPEVAIASTAKQSIEHLPVIASSGMDISDKTIPLAAQNNEEDHQNTYAARQDIVYKELNTSDDDQGVYIGSLELNKNKLRGFFKKATRIFAAKARASADDDGRLQLANMKINTRQ